MNIEFDNDFQQKIMRFRFSEPTTLATKKDVLQWRARWMEGLKTWHSPYKALIDCSNLTVAGAADEMKAELERMLRFFEGFFLKKAAGFGRADGRGHELLPFEVCASEDEGAAAIGIRTKHVGPVADDFRGLIQLQNHFRQHTVELNFAAPAILDSKIKLGELRSKLTNNLMQWHSKWNLLIDCTNLEFAAELHDEFKAMEKFFRGVFLKQVIGYSPRGPKESYPFEVFRARHNAAARLESEGGFSGDDANCKSRA